MIVVSTTMLPANGTCCSHESIFQQQIFQALLVTYSSDVAIIEYAADPNLAAVNSLFGCFPVVLLGFRAMRAHIL